MKKLLLGLGTLATVVAPIAAVVSCSTGTHTDKKDGGATPSATNGKDGEGTFVDGTEEQEEPVMKLATSISEIAPGIIAGKGIADVEFNGDLIRFTYSSDIAPKGDSSDESTDVTNLKQQLRLTFNLKLGTLIKIETASGTYGFMDVTDNMVYKDAFDATKVKVAVDIAYKELKAIPASTGTPDTGNVGNKGGQAVDNSPQTIGHDEALKKAKTMVEDMLDKTNYEMADSEKTKLVNELISKVGDYELSIDTINHGLESDERHGLDDYMILIKGGPIKELTGDEWSSVNDPTADGKQRLMLTKDGDSVASEADIQDADLEARWGESKTQTEDANFVLYLQHNDNTGAVTAQLSQIVKFGDNFYEYDMTKIPNHPELVLSSYIATTDEAVTIGADETLVTVGLHVQVKDEDLSNADSLTLADINNPHGSNAVFTPEFASRLFNAGIAAQDVVQDTLYKINGGTPTAEGIKYEVGTALDMVIKKDKLKELGYDGTKFLTEEEMNNAKQGSGTAAIAELDRIINAHLNNLGLGEIAYVNIGKNRMFLDSSKDVTAAENADKLSSLIRQTDFYKDADVTIVEFIL